MLCKCTWCFANAVSFNYIGERNGDRARWHVPSRSIKDLASKLRLLHNHKLGQKTNLNSAAANTRPPGCHRQVLMGSLTAGKGGCCMIVFDLVVRGGVDAVVVLLLLVLVSSVLNLSRDGRGCSSCEDGLGGRADQQGSVRMCYVLVCLTAELTNEPAVGQALPIVRHPSMHSGMHLSATNSPSTPHLRLNSEIRPLAPHI